MNSIITYAQATAQLTPFEKVGQLFMPAAFINDTEEEILQLEDLIKNNPIGGLCFFHSRASAATNYEGEKKVVYNQHSFETLKKLIQRYQGISKYPLLISIDAEWGLAMRVENTPQYPYAITLGAIRGNNDLLFAVGQHIALDCQVAGIHWNFAPVADINNNPSNPVIGYRSFGEDKLLVAEKSAAFAKGIKSTGVLNSVKHFPGHGDTATDSHLGLPLIEKSKEELLNNELYPFQELMAQGVDSVMVGHLAVPSLTESEHIPTSLSEKMIKGFLRNELGFKGVVVSDALNMHSVSKLFSIKGELEWLAFNAGNDVLCFAENVREGIEMILDKAVERQIEESFERIWKLKERALDTAANVSSSSLINPDALNQKLATECLTFYKGDQDRIENLKKEGFIGIEISQKSNHPFFKSIQKYLGCIFYSSANKTLEELKNLTWTTTDNILLTLFPPKVKPQNNFDISREEIEFIQELILQKNVVLYLFGNPYVLNKIDVENASGVVIVYQDFEVFQENAAQHFLGETKANGILPVTINKETV